MRHFGDALYGLYLFGSLAAGSFRPGRSDLDLLAVLESDVEEGDLAALEDLHEGFVSRHPEWRNRVEIACVSRAVLRTLADVPMGRIAVVSPGEPLHLKPVAADWTINWHGVCTVGETLAGPVPLDLGPVVSPEALRLAAGAQLDEWATEVRAPSVAYVPVQQGYIVVTVCRALYLLETGEQVSKEEAAAWAARRYPAWASFIAASLRQYRGDVRGPHEETIRFVDEAAAAAKRREGD
jgi:predicted nucleotidyltransferase